VATSSSPFRSFSHGDEDIAAPGLGTGFWKLASSQRIDRRDGLKDDIPIRGWISRGLQADQHRGIPGAAKGDPAQRRFPRVPKQGSITRFPLGKPEDQIAGFIPPAK
jgi:hypothetical protein